MSAKTTDGSLDLKQGDLVTVELPSNNTASNVYIVARKLETEAVLEHPLAPGCYVLRNDSELNRVPPTLKNSTEKCLDFASKNLDIFDWNEAGELKALFYYFVINRKLSQRQGRALSCACGAIAASHLRNNINAAIGLVVENKGLLDEYNLFWFETFKPIYEGAKAPSPKQRESIFNQAGFVLAQLESTTARQSGGGLHEHNGQVSKTKSGS